MNQLRTSLLLVSAVLLLVASGCANRPPTLNCVTGSGSLTVTEGTSVKISANAQDPDRNDELSFDWTASAGGRLSADNGSVTFDSAGLDPGIYTVGLTVRDKKQATAVCAVDLNIEKNKQAPVISCDQASTSVNVGESTTLRTTASDANRDTLSYRWSVDGSSISNDQSSFEFGTSGRPQGAHSVTVTVTDVDGMSASCDFNVTISRPTNRDPTVTLSLDKQQVFAGETINATASASDPHDDPLTPSWSVDNQSRPGTSLRLAVNTSGMSGGSHSVTVTVRDDRDGRATDTKSFSVTEKIVIQINQLRPDNIAKAQLDEIALKMQQSPQLRATITGHTDDRGGERGNVRYGQRRADAVKDYLVRENDISEGRIETKSAGESQPMADNSTAQGRQENRRVEVELSVP